MLNSQNKKQKIAIVHDFLTCLGGAERVLLSLHKLYPEASIYTLLYDKKRMQKYFPNAKIKTSFLDKFPIFLKKRKRYLLPFMPTAIETFDLSDFDIVISSTSSFAKGVIVKPKIKHICYCHAPTRFLWDWHFNYLNENKIKGIKKVFILPILHYMRIWDKAASDRVDYFIANSQNTAAKIKKFYNRESEVIYPPVNTTGFKTKSQLSFKNKEESFSKKHNFKNNYFLIVSRLSSYKKIEIAISAFNKLGLPLFIIGDGQDKKRLEGLANKNIKFLGFQSEIEIGKYYQNCYAFIFSGEDDFGITPIEAMSFGKPVLAFRKGGLLETMAEGVTGEFFDDLIPEILADGVRRIKKNYHNYDSKKIIASAEKFSERNFQKEIIKFVKKSK